MEKVSSKTSLFANLSWIVLANVFVKPVWFFFLVMAARILGSEDFGRFNFAQSFVLIFSILYELGMDLYIVREVSTNQKQADKLLGNSLIIKLIFIPLVSLVMIWLVNILGYSETTIRAVYWSIAYLILITTANYLRSFFRGFEKIDYEAITIIVEKIVLCLTGGIALLGHSGVLNFLKWLSLGSLISIIFTAALLFKKLVKPDFSFDFSFMQNTLGQALPFALMNIFILIYFRIDMVMLSLMKNETVVGLYSASYRIMEMLLVIPAVIMIPIYPAMSRLTKNESAKFHELSQISVQGLLLICLPVTLIIFFLAPQFMLFFYGDSDYLTATAALKILVFTLPFNGLTSVFATMLAANNRQIITTRNTAICAGFNILLNMLLIPSYSFIGAAAATLATEGLLAALCYFAVVKSLGEKISSTYLLKFFLLTLFVLSAKLIWQKADLSPYFTSAVSVLFFIVGLFWLKLFDLRFLKLLSNFLK